MAMMSRIFYITGYKPTVDEQKRGYRLIVLTPEPIDENVISRAWGHAVKHTAISLEEPDHDAAIAKMLDENPSWELLEHPVCRINLHLPK